MALPRSVRRSWLARLDQIFQTGYTRAELEELCRSSTLINWEMKPSLMYLMLEAHSEG